MDMVDCTFLTVCSIRNKLSKGTQGLEKWEKEYYHKNRDIIELERGFKQGKNLFDEYFGIK